MLAHEAVALLDHGCLLVGVGCSTKTTLLWVLVREAVALLDHRAYLFVFLILVFLRVEVRIEWLMSLHKL